MPCAAGSAPVWRLWSFTTAQQLTEQLREEGSSSCCAPLMLGNKACHWAAPPLEFVVAWLLPLGPAASGHEDVLRGLWMSRDGASCGLGPLFPPLVLGSAGSMEAALPALCHWKTFKLWEMFPVWLCSSVQRCNRQELHFTREFGTLDSALWHGNVSAHSFSEQEQGHANV